MADGREHSGRPSSSAGHGGYTASPAKMTAMDLLTQVTLNARNEAAEASDEAANPELAIARSMATQLASPPPSKYGGAWPASTSAVTPDRSRTPSAITATSAPPKSSSAKRAYGQVTRIGDDQWRCPDGKTFPRSYLAYRHLRTLKEQGVVSPGSSIAAMEGTASNGKPRRSAHASNRPAQHSFRSNVVPYEAGSQPGHAVIYGRKMDLTSIPPDSSLYAWLRIWMHGGVTNGAAHTATSASASDPSALGTVTRATSIIPKKRINRFDYLPDAPSDELRENHVEHWRGIRQRHISRRKKHIGENSKRVQARLNEQQVAAFRHDQSSVPPILTQPTVESSTTAAAALLSSLAPRDSMDM